MKRLIKMSVMAILVAMVSIGNVWAQAPKSIEALVERYSTNPEVEYVKANKAIVWMIKASAPKGALDGVKNIEIIKFENLKVYNAFRGDADAIFAATRATCESNEKTKNGSSELFVDRKENPTKYMMFMHEDDGNEIFMLMGLR